MSGLNGEIGVDITSRYLGSPAFQAAQADLRKLKDETQAMGGAASAAAGAGKIMGGVFAALQLDKAVDGMVAFHKEALAQVGTYQRLADGVGTNVELWQAYRLSMKEGGVQQSEMNAILGRFNALLGDAAGGKAQAIEAFKSLGINILDANGKLRATPVIMTEVARAISELDNNARKSSAAVKFFGEDGANLAPVLKTLSKDSDDLVEAFKKQGLIVDQETTASLKRLADNSAAADEKMKALYATVAAPIQARALEYVAQLTADLTNRIRAAKGGWVEFMDTVFGGRYGNATMGGLQFDADGTGARLQKIQDFNAQIESLQKRIDNPRRGDASKQQLEALQNKIRGQRDALTAESRATEDAARQARNSAADLDRILNDGLPAKDGFKTGGASNPDGDGGSKRGGFGGSRDRIGENLRQLEGERRAMEQALSRLQASNNVPLRDLERTVEVQRRIDDMVARATKTEAGDKRAGEIRAAATALEQSRYAYQEYIKALGDAEATEARYGDGTRVLAELERDLTRARDTGRLTLETYNIAMREGAYAAEQQRLAHVGARGGMDGMLAGYQSAALAYAKQNNAFNTGARFFQESTSLMTQALRKWRQDGQLDFGSLLGSFVDMCSQMLMQWAATQAMMAMGFGGGGGGGGGGAGGLIGSLISGIAGIAGGMFGGGGGWAIGALGGAYNGGGLPGFGGPRAGGGEVDPSRWYMVGENGPERFRPRTAGTIIPADQAGPANGGGVQVVQHFHISTGVSQTVRAELMAFMPAIEARTVAAVTDRRNRTGDRR